MIYDKVYLNESACLLFSSSTTLVCDVLIVISYQLSQIQLHPFTSNRECTLFRFSRSSKYVFISVSLYYPHNVVLIKDNIYVDFFKIVSFSAILIYCRISLLISRKSVDTSKKEYFELSTGKVESYHNILS
jgi:hypothetical protein